MKNIAKKIIIVVITLILLIGLLPNIEVSAGVPEIPVTEEELKIAIRYYNTFWKYQTLGQKITELQRVPPGELVHWLIPAAQATYTQAQVFVNSLGLTPDKVIRMGTIGALGGIVIIEQDWRAYWDVAFNNQEFMENYVTTGSVVGDWITNFTKLDQWAMDTLEFIGLPRWLGVESDWAEWDATEIYVNGVGIINDWFKSIFGSSSAEQGLQTLPEITMIDSLMNLDLQHLPLPNNNPGVIARYELPNGFSYRNKIGEALIPDMRTDLTPHQFRTTEMRLRNMPAEVVWNGEHLQRDRWERFRIDILTENHNLIPQNIIQFLDNLGIASNNVVAFISDMRNNNVNGLLVFGNEIIYSEMQFYNQTNDVSDMINNPDNLTETGNIPIEWPPPHPMGREWPQPEETQHERAQNILERLTPPQFFPIIPMPNGGTPQPNTCPICPPSRQPWQCPHQRPGQNPHGCPNCPPITTPGGQPQPCNQPGCERNPTTNPQTCPQPCPEGQPCPSPQPCPSSRPRPCPSPCPHPYPCPAPGPCPAPQPCPSCPPQPSPCPNPTCPRNSEHPRNPSNTPPPGRPPPGITFAMFPFCIPWDVFRIVDTLARTPVEPVLEAQPFAAMGFDWTLRIDFSLFQPVVVVVRWVMRVTFVIGLAMITRRFIWTGGG